MLEKGGLCVGLIGGLVMMAAGQVFAADAEPPADTPEVGLESHYLWEYDFDRDRSIGSVNWEEIRLSSKSAERYPELEHALEQFNEGMSSQGQERMDDMIFTAQEMSEDSYYPTNGMSYDDSILVRRADEQVLSFLDYHQDYMGGAHGYYCYSGTSFDVSSGREITLAEIVPDPDALRNAVKEKLLEKYPENDMFWGLDDSLAGYGFGEGDYQYDWVLEQDGISIYFNPYAIAAYASGMQDIFLSFAEYPQLFSDSCSAYEGSYFKELKRNYPEPIVLANGKTAELSIQPEYSSYNEDYTDYSAYDSYSVTIGETTLHHGDTWFYQMRPVLTRLADGRTYLYLECAGDNDGRLINVIDISHGAPVYVGHFDGGFGWSFDEENETALDLFPGNPSDFRLDTRINLLSTYTGVRNYQVGEDGMPQPLQPEYYRDVSSYSMDLVTARELSGSAAEDPTVPVTIPAGTELTIWRTDGNTYVDLIRGDDGTAVRLNVDTSEWPHTINGTDEAECFEMLYYAG